MRRTDTGRYEITTSTGELVRAFIPNFLPPSPSLDMSQLQAPLERALLGLGRLDSIATILPDPHLFLYTYIRKEAVLSSQIEGTQSTLSDLLLFELEEVPSTPMDDVVEVSNYVAALEHGLRRLREDFPLSNRLMREIHGILLSRGRGSEKMPGEFRNSQNWIGGTRPGNAHFVPPPPYAVQDCMSDLENFLHSSDAGGSALIRAGIAHVQFETIHPFLDGNGRVGRLLITFLLCHEGVLTEPLLYLSLYFKRNRDDYINLLDNVRLNGDWETWLEFFLEGVRETSESAVETVRRLTTLFQQDRDRIQDIGRAAGSALRVHQSLTQRPVASISSIGDDTGLSFPTVSSALSRLTELGVVHEATGRDRNRVFLYEAYISILNEGTEV